MRADARRIHDRLLAVAGQVVAEQGVDASLRDIARQADAGFSTLLRHFPSREALLEELLRNGFDDLAARAALLGADETPSEALLLWLREFVDVITKYRGVVSLMVEAIEDEQSALHDSCVAMRSSGTRLLEGAQQAGAVRADIDGPFLFALASSVAWLGDQPGTAKHAGRAFDVVVAGIAAQ